MWGQTRGIVQSNSIINDISLHRLHGIRFLSIISCFLLITGGCGGGGGATDASNVSTGLGNSGEGTGNSDGGVAGSDVAPDDSGNDGIGSGGTSESPSGTGAVALSWIPPTTNIDGTALEDLAGYRLYYGMSKGKYPEMIDINNPGLSSYVIENLSSDTYYFVATAYDADGNESAFSNEAFVTITE